MWCCRDLHTISHHSHNPHPYYIHIFYTLDCYQSQEIWVKKGGGWKQWKKKARVCWPVIDFSIRKEGKSCWWNSNQGNLSFILLNCSVSKWLKGSKNWIKNCENMFSFWILFLTVQQGCISWSLNWQLKMRGMLSLTSCPQDHRMAQDHKYVWPTNKMPSVVKAFLDILDVTRITGWPKIT